MAPEYIHINISFNTIKETDKFVIAVVITDIFGKVNVQFQTVSGQKNYLDIPRFNQNVSSVVIIPASHTRLSGFDDGSVQFRVFSMNTSMSQSAQGIEEGDIVRASGTAKVYVVKNGYRRWIPSPEIFNSYGHLKWENIKEVSQELLDAYKESFFIQMAGDYKVYEVKNGATKQWLNITPQVFESSGRNWSSIYAINEKEFTNYK